MTNTFIKHKPIDELIVTSEYSPNRAYIEDGVEKVKAHNGIDLQASVGKDVYAAHGGQIIKAGTASGYGNVIVIQEILGVTEVGKNIYGKATMYAHLSESEYSNIYNTHQDSKAIVKAGKKIGKTGKSGTDDAHFHFEVFSKEVADDIRTNAKSTSLGIDRDVSRENPRQHFADAFGDDFTTTVNAGNRNIDIEGDSRDNTMVGNSRDNVIKGGEGNDTIEGKGGDNKLYGEKGDDLLIGGSGSGKDTLYGGEGKDKLYGAGGDDKLYGGSEKRLSFRRIG